MFWGIWWSTRHQSWHPVYHSVLSLVWHGYYFPNNPLQEDNYLKGKEKDYSRPSIPIVDHKRPGQGQSCLATKKTGQREYRFSFIGLLKIFRTPLSGIWYPTPTITSQHQHLATKDLKPPLYKRYLLSMNILKASLLYLTLMQNINCKHCT